MREGSLQCCQNASRGNPCHAQQAIAGAIRKTFVLPPHRCTLPFTPDIMASITAAASAVAAPRVQAQRRVAPSAFVGAPVARRQTLVARTAQKAQQQQSRSTAVQVFAVRDGQVLDRPLRVAVIGGGPSGACAAESLAKGGCETYLIERKMDNCKVGPPAARGERQGRPSWSNFLQLWQFKNKNRVL